MKLLMVPFVLSISACALSPEYISGQIEECKEYNLVPVVTIRNNKTKMVNCLPPEDQGYIIIEKGLELDRIPKLPTLPELPL